MNLEERVQEKKYFVKFIPLYLLPYDLDSDVLDSPLFLRKKTNMSWMTGLHVKCWEKGVIADVNERIVALEILFDKDGLYMYGSYKI